MARARKQKFGKLTINLYRRGEIRYEHAYYPNEAAKKATKWARKGWEAKVYSSGSGSYSSSKRTPKTLMECKPSPKKRGSGEFANCTIAPAFKKRIKGL